MALVYALCVCVALCVAVQSRSLLDSANQDSNSMSEETDTLLRIKRSIVNGNELGQGCPLGSIPKGERCMSCYQIGRIYRRHLKFCNESCIDVRQKCTRKRTYA